ADVANHSGLGCDHRGLLPPPGRGLALSPVAPGSYPPPSGDSHSAGHPVVCLSLQRPGPPRHLEGKTLSHSRSTNESARPARARADGVTPIRAEGNPPEWLCRLGQRETEEGMSGLTI